MKPDSHPRRFSDVPRRLPREAGAEPSGTWEPPPFTLDDLFRDDPTDDEVDEAIDQIASEGCGTCPRCGLIAPREGRGPGGAARRPRSPRPGLG